MKHRKWALILVPVCLISWVARGAGSIPAWQDGLDLWRTQLFSGKTDYRLQQIDGEVILAASSRNAASGLMFEQTVDLTRTPFLNWRWRVDQGPEGNNEREPEGDDFAARVYLIADGGWLFWKTRALNYVWSSGDQKGRSWPNPYAGDAVQVLALRGRGDPKGEWVVERRNVREDFERFFGISAETIDAIAIMTDSDDTGQPSKAFYGDLHFSAE